MSVTCKYYTIVYKHAQILIRRGSPGTNHSWVLKDKCTVFGKLVGFVSVKKIASGLLSSLEEK